jgi:hypothetical protein
VEIVGILVWFLILEGTVLIFLLSSKAPAQEGKKETKEGGREEGKRERSREGSVVLLKR